MHGKTVVFVTQRHEVEPALRVREHAQGEVVYVATRPDHLAALRERGVACRYMPDYLQRAGGDDLRKKVVLWVDEWADRPLADGRSVKEALAYQGLSLWWFLLPAVFPDFLRCALFLEGTLAVLSQEAPERVCVVDVGGREGYPFRLNQDINLPARIVAMVCRSRGVAVEHLPATLASRLASAHQRCRAVVWEWGFYLLGKPLVGRLRRCLSGGAARPSQRMPGRGRVVVFSSPVYWRDTVGEGGERVEDDAVAGACIRHLAQSGYELVGVDVEINRPNWRQFGVLRRKRRQRGILWRAIEAYRRPAAPHHRRRRAAALRSLAEALQEEDRLIQAVEYHGVRFGEALRGRFGFLLHRYLRETLDHLELAEAVVACERPDLLMIVYEEGPYGRAAIIAGHRHGIPTLALQHGTLSGPFLPAYYFRRVSTDVRHDPVACPIPTCTAVYGRTTKEMLTRVSTYPEESVAVIGMPAYDAVIRSVVGLAPERVQTQLGPRIGEPVVLVLSQPFLSNENRQFFINLVLVGAQQNAEVKWVVKLHPGESSEDWRAAIRTYGAGNVKLAKGQLHQWLVACRLVVAWFSTAILEAVVYAKPVITVRIPGCQNADCYVEDGIAQAVGDQEELVRAVRALLRGGTTYAGAVGRSRANLDAYVFQPDGHAAERMTRLVGRLIDGRRQAGQSLPRGAENQ